MMICPICSVYLFSYLLKQSVYGMVLSLPISDYYFCHFYRWRSSFSYPNTDTSIEIILNHSLQDSLIKTCGSYCNYTVPHEIIDVGKLTRSLSKWTNTKLYRQRSTHCNTFYQVRSRWFSSSLVIIRSILHPKYRDVSFFGEFS